MTTLPDVVFGDPLLTAALGVVLAAVVHYQQGLAYTEVVALERLKYHAARRLDSYLRERGRPLISKKRFDHPDHVVTLNQSPREVARALRAGGFAPQLLSTVKIRAPPNYVDEPVPAVTQWAFDHGDGDQTHCYLFPENGRTAVFAHVEPVVTDAEAHEGGEEQQHGDVRGAVANALESAERK